MENKLQEWWNSNGLRYTILFLQSNNWPDFKNLPIIRDIVIIDKDQLEFIILASQIIILKTIYGSEAIDKWMIEKLKETINMIQFKIGQN